VAERTIEGETEVVWAGVGRESATERAGERGGVRDMDDTALLTAVTASLASEGGVEGRLLREDPCAASLPCDSETLERICGSSIEGGRRCSPYDCVLRLELLVEVESALEWFESSGAEDSLDPLLPLCS
jgi:hypothetical protein